MDVRPPRSQYRGVKTGLPVEIVYEKLRGRMLPFRKEQVSMTVIENTYLLSAFHVSQFPREAALHSAYCMMSFTSPGPIISI